MYDVDQPRAAHGGASNALTYPFPQTVRMAVAAPIPGFWKYALANV